MKNGPKPRKPGYRIDKETFALFLYARRTVVRGLSMVDAAAEAGVSVAAVHRAEHRLSLDSETFLALALWIEANPYWFLVDPATGRPVAEPPAADVSQGVSRETHAVTRGRP